MPLSLRSVPKRDDLLVMKMVKQVNVVVSEVTVQ